LRWLNRRRLRFFKEDFEDQTYSQKVFSAIWMLHGQVLNGGFEQYFFNYSGCTIAFVVEALEAIRDIELANICSRAIKIEFPEGLPLQLDPDSILATFSPSFEKLDSLAKEYYKTSDDVIALLYNFVLRYPEEFGSEPFSH
jgi:hypothetical protein